MPPSWPWHYLMGMPWSKAQMKMVIPRMIKEALLYLMKPQRLREKAPYFLLGTYEEDMWHPRLDFRPLELLWGLIWGFSSNGGWSWCLGTLSAFVLPWWSIWNPKRAWHHHRFRLIAHMCGLILAYFVVELTGWIVTKFYFMSTQKWNGAFK